MFVPYALILLLLLLLLFYLVYNVEDSSFLCQSYRGLKYFIGQWSLFSEQAMYLSGIYFFIWVLSLWVYTDIFVENKIIGSQTEKKYLDD